MVVRFAGEGVDEVTGWTLGPHPNYLSRSIISLEHRLYRFSSNVVNLLNAVHSFFFGVQKQYYSRHDMMATQLR